jgi:hypothetical protein
MTGLTGTGSILKGLDGDMTTYQVELIDFVHSSTVMSAPGNEEEYGRIITSENLSVQKPAKNGKGLNRRIV